MFRVVIKSTRRVIEIVGQKGQVGPCRGVTGQILDRAVHGLDPAVLVRTKAIGVVQIHLDEVLVVTVGATGPAALAVYKTAIGNRNFGAQEAREGLAQFWVQGVDEIRLALFRELAIGGVACEIREAGPFQDQSADGGDAVGGRVGQACWAQVDAVVGDAGGGVKSKLESVAEVLGFGKDGLGEAAVGVLRGERANKEVVACASVGPTRCCCRVSASVETLLVRKRERNKTHRTTSRPDNEWWSQRQKRPCRCSSR